MGKDPKLDLIKSVVPPHPLLGALYQAFLQPPSVAACLVMEEYLIFRNSWVAFAGSFGVIILLHCEILSNEFSSFWLSWAESRGLYTSASILLLLSSHFISKHSWPGSTVSPMCPCNNTAFPMFDRYCGGLGMMIGVSPSPYFSLPVFWFKLI